MKLHHVRTKKIITISNPILFLAKDRNIIDEAWAGDIIGIPNHQMKKIKIAGEAAESLIDEMFSTIK